MINPYLIAVGVSSAPPEGWATCGGLPDAVANTACLGANQTCCKQNWMPSQGVWEPLIRLYEFSPGKC